MGGWRLRSISSVSLWILACTGSPPSTDNEPQAERTEVGSEDSNQHSPHSDSKRAESPGAKPDARNDNNQKPEPQTLAQKVAQHLNPRTWPPLAGGPSKPLLNPAPGKGPKSLAQEIAEDSNRGILINEIMYHPQDGKVRGEFIELYNSGPDAVNLSDWKFSRGVNYQFSDVTIPARGYLVVAADPQYLQSQHQRHFSTVGGWQGRLSNRGETLELVDAQGNTVDRVRYADQGDWARRVRGSTDKGTAGWVWQADHDGEGKSLELINPRLSNLSGQNWSASRALHGTPGKVNSAAQRNIAPLIVDVKHHPILPQSKDTVKITAKIADEAESGNKAKLHWRIDGTSRFQSSTMKADPSSSGDKVTTFTSDIPPQPAGTVIEFYVQASDAQGRRRTWPASTAGHKSPETRLLYQVIDTPRHPRLGKPQKRIVFHQIMTAADRKAFHEIDRESNAQMHATFISVSEAGVEVRYNAGVRLRGSGSRRKPVPNNRINLPSDRPWHGITKLNLNTVNVEQQIAGSVLHHLAGLPAAKATGVLMLSNGANRLGRGFYAWVEPLNSEFLGRQFPEYRKGQLYRGFRAEDSPAGSKGAGLRYFGSDPAPYLSYAKLTRSREADWSDVIELTRRINAPGNAHYQGQLEEVADVDQWLRVLALNVLLDNREGGLFNGDPEGDDYALFNPDETNRFWLLPHDLDTLFVRVDEQIFRARQNPALNRILRHPEFKLRYFAQLHDLISGPMKKSAISSALDDALRGMVPKARIEAIKSFVERRGQHILTLIEPKLLAASENLGLGKTEYAALGPKSQPGQDRKGATASTTPAKKPVPVALPPQPTTPQKATPATPLSLKPANEVDNSAFEKLEVRVRNDFLPGVPVLVWLEAQDRKGEVQRNLWDAQAKITVKQDSQIISEHQVRLYNGKGSILLTLSAAKPTAITASLGSKTLRQGLQPRALKNSLERAGRLTGQSSRWSTIQRITGDLIIPKGHTLTIKPGTIVVLEGDPVGAIDSTRMIVKGELIVQGTKERPVTFTSTNPDQPWGQILIDGGKAHFSFAHIHRAGNATRMQHASCGAAILMQNEAQLEFRQGSITDIHGKILQSISGSLHMSDSLFSRAALGPEIKASSLKFFENWVLDMNQQWHPQGKLDSNDGIYIRRQPPGQSIELRGGVVAQTLDDGIDTYQAEARIHNYIVRNTNDKAISINGGELGANLSIERSMLSNAKIGINAKTRDHTELNILLDQVQISKVKLGLVAQDKGIPDPHAKIRYDVNRSSIKVLPGGKALSSDYDINDIKLKNTKLHPAPQAP